jgi:hypothetical protein
MSDMPNNKIWAKAVVLMGAALLAFSATRTAPAGLDLSIDGKGVSFALKGGFLNLAFDFGHERPESDTAKLGLDG